MKLGFKPLKDNLHLILIGCVAFVLSYNIDTDSTDILSYFLGCYFINYVFETFVGERKC